MTDSKNPESFITERKLAGSCLCGSVDFEVEAPLREIISCYCSECRKTSGNYVSATRVNDSQLNFIRQDGLKWYKNKQAQRGFCRHCGSSLFWKLEPGDDKVSIMAGCLQADTGFEVMAHIFVADKSDFHRITDQAPQFQQADK